MELLAQDISIISYIIVVNLIRFLFCAQISFSITLVRKVDLKVGDTGV